MENKKNMFIYQILENTLIGDDFLKAALSPFSTEFEIDFLDNNNAYTTEISIYKNNLRTRLSVYLDNILHEDELAHMIEDDNSTCWHRINNEEYLNIIREETRKFGTDLQQKLNKDGVRKKSKLKKLKEYILNKLFPS